jgi:UTP--glucose-1-phosphate uridylyltransferase
LLSPVLAQLCGREKYLALEAQGRRHPLDTRYGLLTAQLALALNGRDREEVLATLCEMLAQCDSSSGATSEAQSTDEARA